MRSLWRRAIERQSEGPTPRVYKDHDGDAKDRGCEADYDKESDKG